MARPSTPAPRHAEAVPEMRLPAGVTPTKEKIELEVDPGAPRFRGAVDISVHVASARRTLWLHGKGLHVTKVTLTPEGKEPITGAWAERGRAGVAEVALAADAPAGEAVLHIEYDAEFQTGTRGLFRTKQRGIDYAFTQFEPADARRAFPCFDEPSFKIPFEVALVVPAGAEAVSNTPEAARENENGKTRVRFRATQPLPSYLVAFGVGPLDIVVAPDVPPNHARARPLPLRGVAAKGRGKELAYALAHAGEILSTLERWFDIAYPYEKLDLLAVPDLEGAMENAGCVTFHEGLLLLDEKTASLSQKQAYAGVVAHELAHQWFGDLVTMGWWDDIWLNESFANWLGPKAADAWNPASGGGLDLMQSIQNVMGTDSLASARRIRQPIESNDDIENAFDSITYDKGAGVLRMFEHWLGEEPFKRGVRAHIAAHRFGNATADDFLGALSKAAGKDVTTAYHTFLDQPGVPFIEASVACGGAPKLHLTQSRFLPLGSTGDANQSWQVPVCARYAVGAGAPKEACTLLTEREGDLALDGCPSWVMPNAGGMGYYRFALADQDLAKLRDAGVRALRTEEKMAFGNSLRAGRRRGRTKFGDALLGAAPMASDGDARVAGEAAGFLGEARDWLYADPLRAGVEAYTKKLYGPVLARLGITPKRGESNEARELRVSILRNVLYVARDPAARAEAKRLGLAYLGIGKDGKLHREVIEEDLVATVLGVAFEDADAKMFDTVLALLQSIDDSHVRGFLIHALASAQDPSLALRARELGLSDALRKTETLSALWSQFSRTETREAAWSWIKERWDAALGPRITAELFGGVEILGMVDAFCDETHAADVESFFAERVNKIEGGPRALRSTVESIPAVRENARLGRAERSGFLFQIERRR